RVSGQSLWRNGERDAEVSREMGMVFQDANLFPWYSIEKNIALPLQLRGVDKKTRTAKAHELCDLVGIGGFEKRWPRELSGGMRKRAGLARALALDPEIVFLDEPTAGLDPIGAAAFDELVRSLQSSLGLTVFMVTHDLDSLHAVCDRIAVLGDKHVIVTGSMAEMLEQDHPWIRDYFHGPRGRAAR
ncbi:MAG: ATP-binding cassette domain-containing protein, partial [Rhodospirillaceae bacterium]|nr:ATP-binding cassette domain-containing protein [Rhodospirillaceae bacterium]